MNYPVFDPDGSLERLAQDYNRAVARGEGAIALRILAAHAAEAIAAERRDARWDGTLLAANDQDAVVCCGCDLCDAGGAR